MKKIAMLSLMLCFLFMAGCQTTPKQGADYENWQSKVTGTYNGIIFSGELESPGITRIFKDANGNFKGNYEFSEKNTKITGTLYNFNIISPLELKCKWQDNYGSGDLSMSFNSAIKGFSGRWNADGQSTRYPWNGSK